MSVVDAGDRVVDAAGSARLPMPRVRVPAMRVGRFRLLLLAVTAALVLGLARIAMAGETVGVESAGLAIALASAVILSLGFVSAMSWISYREYRLLPGLFHCSGFLLLFVAGVATLAVLLVEPARLGGPFDSVWWQLQWLAAGLLFSAGAALSLRGVERSPVSAPLVVLAPALVWLPGLVLILAATGHGSIWGHAEPSGAPVPAGIIGVQLAPVIDPAIVLHHLPAVLALLLAAGLHARLYEVTAVRSRAWLTIALLLLAGAQAFAAIEPDHAPWVVSVDQLLVVLAITVVLVAIMSASRSNARSLRLANEELRAARASDLEQATLQERTRLAREIHDNLIQSLWLARLRQGHVLATDLPPESRALAEEVVDALDGGLAEARDVVLALAPGPDGPLPFDRVLSQSLARQAERLDLDVRLAVDGAVPVLEPRVQGELLTIARESLVNIAKHADAAVVRVRLAADARRLVLEIADNGNGFDPAAVAGGFGLRSMRQRAAAIGATLSIDARPLDGTRIAVVLPRPADGGVS
jgi:signal transduction histidine kinase